MSEQFPQFPSNGCNPSLIRPAYEPNYQHPSYSPYGQAPQGHGVPFPVTAPGCSNTCPPPQYEPSIIPAHDRGVPSYTQDPRNVFMGTAMESPPQHPPQEIENPPYVYRGGCNMPPIYPQPDPECRNSPYKHLSEIERQKLDTLPMQYGYIYIYIYYILQERTICVWSSNTTNQQSCRSTLP